MNIERYSSSYIKTEDNFVVISEQYGSYDDTFRNSTLFGVFCVVRNILQRGNPNYDGSKTKPEQHPTKPSNYLRSIIDYEAINEEVCLISSKPNKWDKTIKGDDKNLNYPARVFYDKMLPYALGKEYAFAKNLVLPEAEFEEIIGEDTSFRGQCVDFYLPQAHLVIEIDGAGHKDAAQINKDHEREKELRKHGINTVRIKTSEISKNSDDLEYELHRIGRIVSSSDKIKKYKESSSLRPKESAEKLETIMRMQILILSLLMKGKLNLSSDFWHFFIEHSDINGLEQLIEIAYQDLQFWIKAVSGLNGIGVKFPQIVFCADRGRSDIVLDYSLYQRYDDTCNPNGNLIYIRTDYYSGKNHFKVAVANSLKYNLDLRKNKTDRLNLMFLLQNIFGFDEFRDGQEQIIENIMNGKDTIGVLPTGTGKSICYQLPALLQPGVTIIVDPIISLMMDQKRTLEVYHDISQNNFIASNQVGSVKGKIVEDFKNGRYQMLWISPERFQSEVFRNSLIEINENLNFCLAVIDEVHCLSEWGHDFRIPYLTLVKTLRQFCPKAVLLGLTATASQFVIKDIQAEFGKAGNPLEIKNVIALRSMDRKELKFIRIPVKGDVERDKLIRSIIRKETNLKTDNKCQGLLFCKTINSSPNNRTSCFDMKSLLEQPEEDGSPIISEIRLFYGKMDDAKKRTNQESFMNGEFPLMICTKAFGMGIDNPNIRYTIHNSLPSSVESFYQEAGRAGRDRRLANCYVIYNVDAHSREVVNSCEATEDLLNLLNMGPILDGCDLGTTIFFYNTNHEDEDEETQAISDTLSLLKESPIIPFDNTDKEKIKQKIEKSLYKLSTLGIVKDWTINYKSLIKGDCIVRMAAGEEISYENSLANLITYIKKYDVELDLETDEEYAEIYSKKDKDIMDVARMLVRWTNNNILYNRIQCSKTMVDWCSDKVSDELFRERLEAYFRLDVETESLRRIADNPKDWKEWFKVFFRNGPRKKKKGDLVDLEEVRKNHATLQRFLESYQNNIGLNYLDGLFQLLYKEEVEDHELLRMNRSIDTIQQMDEDDQFGIVRSTLEIASAINNPGTLIALSKLIINRFPEMSRMVYEYLHDDYSLMIELEKGVRRMEAIQWNI